MESDYETKVMDLKNNVILLKMPFSKTFVIKTDTISEDWHNNLYDDLEDYVKKQKFLTDNHKILVLNDDNSRRNTFSENSTIKILRDSTDNGLIMKPKTDGDYVFCNFTMTLHAFLPKGCTIDKAVDELLFD